MSSSIFVKCDCGMTEFLGTGEPGYTQHTNESINSLVWNKCPKHKWHGKSRVQLGASSTALHFSGVASAKHAVMDKVGRTVGESARTVGESAKKEARRRDS